MEVIEGLSSAVKLFVDAAPASVSRDGTQLSRVETAPELDAAEAAWRFDAEKQALTVKFVHTGGTTLVQS